MKLKWWKMGKTFSIKNGMILSVQGSKTCPQSVTMATIVWSATAVLEHSAKKR